MLKLRLVALLVVAATTSCVNSELTITTQPPTASDIDEPSGTAPLGGGATDKGPRSLAESSARTRPGWVQRRNSMALDPELKSSISYTTNGTLSDVAGTPERLYVAFRDGDVTSTNSMEIVAFDARGEQRWVQRFDHDLTLWAVDSDVMVFEDLDGDDETAGGILHRLSGNDGSILWTHAASALASSSTDYDGKSVMTDGQTVDVVELKTGKTVAKQSFDRVGDVLSLNTTGGFVVHSDGRAVALDAELNEITDGTLVGDGAEVWYFNDGLLAVEGDTAEFYDDDGLSDGWLRLLVEDPSVRVVDPTTFVYTGDGRCGTIDSDESVAISLWTSNPCFVRDARLLSDGRSYTVVDITDEIGDLGSEQVHDTETGRTLIAPASSITLEENGFFSMSSERGAEWYSLDGNLVYSDPTSDSIEQLDGGYLAYSVDLDSGQHSINVYGD